MWTTIYTVSQKVMVILHASFWPTCHARSALQQSVDQKIGAHTQKIRCFYFCRQQNRFLALIWCLSFDESRLTNLVIDWPFVWFCVYVCGEQKRRELCWWGAANAFATLKISRKNKRRLSAGRRARFLCVHPLPNKREREREDHWTNSNSQLKPGMVTIYQPPTHNWRTNTMLWYYFWLNFLLGGTGRDCGMCLLLWIRNQEN